MFQSNKIHNNVLHNNFVPNYNSDVENSNDIENTNYSFQFLGNTTQVLKGEHNLAYNNNYVSESISISEWDLYGSSRLGVRRPDKEHEVELLAARDYNWISNALTNEVIAPVATVNYRKFRLLGAKTFELSNHLGNVVTTISDRKLMVEDAANPGYVHHYTPEILSIGEQYAFGMRMPGRTYNVENYRYGFNGKENQDELLGEDNAQDFGARMYDARVGRWWGLDPNQNSYAHLSPYNAMENNPIYFNDPDGKDATVTIVGNTILISTKIYVTGWGALEEVAENMEKEISKAWNGFTYKGYNMKFAVDVEVMKPNMKLEPNSNVIYMTHIPQVLGDGRSFVESQGNTGCWLATVDPISGRYHWQHEFGHLLGLDDGYFEKFVDISNNLATETYFMENYNNNIMADGHYGKVDQSLINLLGDHIFSKMPLKNVEFKFNNNRMVIKGGGHLKLPSTSNDKEARKLEYKKTQPRSKSNNSRSSNKTTRKNGSGNSGGHTRNKNPRFL